MRTYLHYPHGTTHIDIHGNYSGYDAPRTERPLDIHIRLDHPHYIDIHIGLDYLTIQHKYITLLIHKDVLKIGNRITQLNYIGPERATIDELIAIGEEICTRSTVYGERLPHKAVSTMQLSE